MIVGVRKSGKWSRLMDQMMTVAGGSEEDEL